jgi:endonuclease/exonuclease/phosphatase family metal-dependent hydrolase
MHRPARTHAGLAERGSVITTDNDHFSESIGDIVPVEFRGTNRYLDVVQWNIEWFGAAKSTQKDSKRRNLVLRILQTLNADLFIFQEIAGPSADGRRPGVLDDIAAELTRNGAGDYAVDYTQAGGEQRVAMMWDRDWLRSKDTVTDLFPRGTHPMPDGKDAFAGRTPLFGYFTARVPAAETDNIAEGPGSGSEKFDFQVLGVHLKAMAEGAAQRRASAEVLARWLKEEVPMTDSDAMIMGDWNADPGDPCWEPIAALETINDPSDFSYLWLANRSNKFVSRIDLSAITLSSAAQVVGKPSQVVRWKPIQDVIQQAGSMTKPQVVAVLKEIKETISDHLPTLNRFYFKK